MKLSAKHIACILAIIAVLTFALLSLQRSDSPKHQYAAMKIEKTLDKLYGYLDDAHGGEPPSKRERYFRRISTFPVFLNTDIELETVSEIVSATEDGMTLVYTDSEQELLGFVDISDPYNPEPDGVVELGGEPTSVTVTGKYALACINTSADFVDTSGVLIVIDIDARSIVREIELGGQPDAIAASPDGQYAGIVIENERDEDDGPNDGAPPQLPSGFVVIVDLVGSPATWSLREVDLAGVADKFPEDAEPEFIDINRRNIAAVSLQENNHIALIDLQSGVVVNDFPAGTVNLKKIDTEENDLIEFNSSLSDVPREPDALTWVSDYRIATADEGDLDGGSRGFTIFNRRGDVRFTSGSNDDHLVGMIGHYPEDRSENKGNEPEGIEFAKFGRDSLLFVGSERSSVVSVYKLNDRRKEQPEFLQVLPAGVGPEGILAIPQRNLLVVASEVDARDDKFRSTITVYKHAFKEPTYPTVASEDRKNGTPIPWAALSALAANKKNPNRAWTTYDSFYQKSRIFRLDTSATPAIIDKEIVLKDTYGAFAATIADANAKGYEDIVLEDLINEDSTINVDPEGLARRRGGFWLASEGSGTIGDDDRPILTQDWIFKVANNGDIEAVVSLPDAVNAKQQRFGFEGVASVGNGNNEVLYVCFQREWDGDPDDHVRIGRYEVGTGDWTFYYYPIDAPESPNGGWVGLSEIVALTPYDFLVIERDNQGGLDARIKKIYHFSTEGVTPLPESSAPAFPVLDKYEARDLIPDLIADNGSVIEKVEGLAALANGELIIVTDNDGVDDSSGETQFINLGTIE